MNAWERSNSLITFCTSGETSKEGFLPTLGRPVWQSRKGSVYRAYIFQNGHKNCGHLRFHTYDLGAKERIQALKEVDQVIVEFKRRKVSGVVLDQTGNSGGNFIFGYSLLSKLTDRRLRTPLQRYIIDQGKLVGFGNLAMIKTDLQQFAKVETDAEAFKLLSDHAIPF